MSEAREYRKPLDCPEWRKLHEIGLAIERKGLALPSVRRDSEQWRAWRTYLHSIGLPTSWSDKQPGDRMLTVTTEWPPTDLSALHALWVKGSKSKGAELKE